MILADPKAYETSIVKSRPQPKEKLWCEDWSAVVALGEWMIEEDKIDLDNLWSYLRKPWNWTDEWSEFLKTPSGSPWVAKEKK